MRAYRELHGEKVIPYGDYCYYNLKISDRVTPDGLPILETDVCPYWDRIDGYPEQMNGYCWYLEQGDWEEGTFGMLWDQCKCCGINEYNEEDFDDE